MCFQPTRSFNSALSYGGLTDHNHINASAVTDLKVDYSLSNQQAAETAILLMTAIDNIPNAHEVIAPLFDAKMQQDPEATAQKILAYLEAAVSESGYDQEVKLALVTELFILAAEVIEEEFTAFEG